MDIEEQELEAMKLKLAVKKRNCELSNQIMRYARENKMTYKEIMECMEIVKDFFYSDAIILL